MDKKVVNYMKALHMIAWILVIIGGLNWLLIGLFNLNVVTYLGDTLARIVYVLVGLSALYELFTHKANCKMCSSSPAAMPTRPAGM
jgi:uncharacterized membrane protein YuzA (DUF378 family)